jgi:hypothetical protein
MQFIERHGRSQTTPLYRVAASTARVEAIRNIVDQRASSWHWESMGSGPSCWYESVVLVIDTEPIARNECADPLWARKIENIWLTFNEVTTNVYFATARSSGVRTFPVETRADLRFIEMITTVQSRSTNSAGSRKIGRARF